VQGDILDLPFRPESFDFVSSDQVIHHTPDPSRAFAELAGLLRPGGHIAVYVYRVKAMLRELADTELRKLTTRMSVEECMEFSEQITELGRELSRTGATVKLERGVPLLGIEPGEHDVQRLVYWTFLKAFWSDDFSERLNTLVNFDWYHPPYASRHTEDEVRGWCADAGLEVEHRDLSESGISVLARRSV
jgi:SAM-dependent methyltransferase